MSKIKILRNFALTLLLIFISQQTLAAPASIPVNEAHFQEMVLHYINEYRVKHNRQPLKLVNPITVQASIHSRDMAKKAVSVGHDHFNTRIQRLYKEIKDCRGGAENVAYWRYDAKKLVDGWIASPGHRQNIMGNYNLTGIGIAHGKSGWGYFTQIFLRSDDQRYA